MPERRALIGTAPRDQQGTRGVLAEPRAEERTLPHFLDDELLQFVGRDQDVVGRRRRVGVREMDRDAVIRPDRLHL